jgi:hypothetical protein
MSSILTELDQTVAFFDTHNGEFWKEPADVTDNREISNKFTAVNARGETREFTLDQITVLANLLTPPVYNTPEEKHPAVVLNNVWMALVGVQLVADPAAVASFAIDFVENKILAEVKTKSGNTQTVSIVAGIAARIFVLKCFAAIDDGLASGMSAWPGQCAIKVDLENGNVEIVGIRPLYEGELTNTEEGQGMPAEEAMKLVDGALVKKKPVAKTKKAPAAKKPATVK